MLEYPLWYSQFLGIFAVLTGSNDKRLYTLPLSRITHSTLCLIPVLGLFLLFNTGTSFLALEKFFEAARLGQPTPGDVQELVPISNGGLLKDTGIKYFAVMFKLDSKQYEERMGIVEKAMRMEPIPPLLYKQAAYLAYSGKHEEALKQFRMAVSSFPSYLSNFKAQVASLSASDQEKLAFLFADPSAQQILAH
jgi:tetratricopeptide (TPR) repeat protein